MTIITMRTSLRKGRTIRYILWSNLYDPKEDMDIKEALARLFREIADATNERLKRAMDLSMKHEYLYDDLQRMPDYKPYIADIRLPPELDKESKTPS
ncbi:hypothetical protein IFM89_026021 [Coptis chinensis]|uniref:Uncharacterized protein n=1 Tax=Coptis chinensis TaxID=261450 RepID=A0A835M436_9MAGN|nr:hypothetical protein IFM89_026021 [Coptis chinensis]